MQLSVAQRFLVEATRATGPDEYFRWHAVAATLGYSEAEARQAMQSLDDRKLVILLLEGNARLLDAGRQMGAKLEARLIRAGEATRR